ncbi:hypothetical protein AMTRI_Chr07g78320 [Amborella trichopoda]
MMCGAYKFPHFPSSSLASWRNSATTPRAKMASSGMSSVATEVSPSPPLPEKRILLGCGSISTDFLAAVKSYPKPDDKIRTTSLEVQGGGNAGNALTGAARLGLKPRLISKVANDAQGQRILAELEADGIDTSYIVVLLILIKTRTCIHTPGNPPMVPEDLAPSSLSAALDGASLLYLDGRLHETALVVSESAVKMSIPILIDAERKREGLDDLLNLSDYVVCSANFPVAWTSARSIGSALVDMLMKLPKLKFVIVTLGESGCIMLERSLGENHAKEETDVDQLVVSMKQKLHGSGTAPTCISSELLKLRAGGIGTINGRLLVGTAEKIPPSELIDTTGAGDAFICAILYAICAGMPSERMLPFAAQVAAIGCRALGARAGLPRHGDPRLTPYL